MPRLPASVPTDVELSILNVLWERGDSTVREIHDALSDQRDVGYSTTLKMVQVMTEKGLVLKDDSRRPQVYRTAMAQEKTQLQLLDDLIHRGFGGSAAKLVLRAVAAKRISNAELSEIRKLLAQAREEKP